MKVLRGPIMLATILPGLLCSLSATLADAPDLQENAPLQVEDATPAELGSTQGQVSSRYERQNGQGLWRVEPQLQWGFARGWQAETSIPLRLGTGDRTGSGDIRLGVLRRFANSRGSRPAMAFAARADLPTGRNSQGIDTTLKFIASRELGGGLRHRLHFNTWWTRNAGAQVGERSNRYGVVLGYDRPLGTDSRLILDFVHQQARQQGQTENIVEVGWRHDLTQDSTLGLGVGLGLGQDSPDYQLTVSYEQGLG